MGDFNYRVNKTMEEVEKIIENKEELKLLEFDQMNYEIKNYNLKSLGYYEGKISFLPTYKYSDDGSNEIVAIQKSIFHLGLIEYYIKSMKINLKKSKMTKMKMKKMKIVSVKIAKKKIIKKVMSMKMMEKRILIQIKKIRKKVLKLLSS